MVASSRRHVPAYRSELGRQLTPAGAGVVRPANAGSRRVRRDLDVLLYPGILRRDAALYQPTTAYRRICRLLRPDGTALCQWDFAAAPTTMCRHAAVALPRASSGREPLAPTFG